MLNLPAQINCPEPEGPDAVEDMMHPDQRAIVAAGRKVNAMFETISQVNKNVLQVSFVFCPPAQCICICRFSILQVIP